MKFIKTVNVYIAKYILLMSAISIIFIVSLDIFFNFLAVQNSVGTGNFGLSDAFLYAVLCSPGHLTEIFPIVILLGIVFGLGVLSYRSELIILQTNGLSISHLFGIILTVGLIMSFVNMSVAEFVAPKARQLAELKKAIAKSGSFAATSKQGVWLKLNNDFIHIDEILLDGSLVGVTQYKILDNHVQQIRKADKLQYKNHKWYAQKVTITNIGNNEVVTKKLDFETWSKFLKPDFLEVVSISPDQLGIRDLLKFIEFRKENKLNNKSLKLALYQKLSEPFIVIIMILIGLPFVFNKQRSLNFGLKAFLAILLGLVYFLVSRTFLVMVQAYKWPLIIGILGPGLIFGSFAILLMLRTLKL